MSQTILKGQPQMPDFTTSSVATIVSLYPFDFEEFKPGLTPNNFQIKGAPIGKFSRLVVPDAKFPVYLDGDRGSIWVTVPSLVLANSIIGDFIKAQHGYQVNHAHPGMFFVPGDISEAKLLGPEYKEHFEIANQRQFNWLKQLVFLADDDWSKFHQHRFITSVQRFAAKSLKIEREWAIEVSRDDKKACPACARNIMMSAIVCEFCRTVLDKSKFDKLGLVQATVQ